VKIAQHAQIESVLALKMSLADTLLALGLTYVPGGRAYRQSILENGREVYRGSCSDVWEWLRMGGTWEDPDV
jgi:hypothetical protein